MGYILIQPENSPESIAAIKLLESTGGCLFDLTLSGPRIMSVLFNSRSNLVHENGYHSFIGEISCGRWSISHPRRYL